VYSQEKLLRYALPFDGVPPDVRGRFCEGVTCEGDVFTFRPISSSSNDATVGMLSFRMFMLAIDGWRQFGDWVYGTITSSNFEDDEDDFADSSDCEEGQSFSTVNVYRLVLQRSRSICVARYPTSLETEAMQVFHFLSTK
jgi:hypothetical protein